jgi:gliding motility-associated-like protein
MQKVLLYVAVFLTCAALHAQTLVHAGGRIVAQNGAQIIVKGDVLCKGGARYKTNSISYLKVTGDWINNANNAYFHDNQTRIEFDKATLEIKGNTVTHFPWLNLSGNGMVSLFSDVLVGGSRGGGLMGQLKLNSSKLALQGRTLILNNPQANAITRMTGGGIISETNSSLGYGHVQWNIRNGNGGPVFNVPLLNEDGEDITVQFFVNGGGNDIIDSGYVTIATYPTANVAAPNNRPLPLGVFNTDNECDGENSVRLVNRYWIIDQSNYTTTPDITLNFNYSQKDVNGSFDNIDENHLGGIQWNPTSQRWQYPLKGSVDPSNNRFSYRARQNFAGVWTLSDTTPFPKAQFTVLGDCEKDSILFSDISVEGNDKIIQRQWLFGDGNGSNGKNVVHFYNGNGLFDSKLIIRSQSGCEDTADKRVMVNAAPTANFDLWDTCENAWVKVKSNSWPGSGFIDRLEWDFGMGGPTQSTTEAQYNYGAVGLPEIRLIVYNSKGCKDTFIRNPFIAPKPYAFGQFTNVCQGSPVTFSNASVASGGSLISHYWDFGNGSRSNAGGETLTYSEYGVFPVVYAVQNSFGCKDTQRSTIEIYPRAVAKFQYQPFEPEMMKEITFMDQSLHANLWEWDFGDSYFSTDQNPKHSYENHGRYTVQLIANTAYNCADTLSRILTVKSTPLYWIPDAFSPGTTEGRNDSFGIITPLRIHDYDMSIYNRWGQEIFRSSDPKSYWDGTYRGEMCSPGTYVYHVTFKSPENDILTYKGSVILLR